MKSIKTKAEKRDVKKKPRMKVSGKSVFKVKAIIDKKSKGC
jgi:hypothetical protein